MAAATMAVPALASRLDGHLKELRLPAIRASYAELARQAIQETLSYEHYLLELLEREAEARSQHRIERWLHESRLPLEKSLQAFDLERLPAKVRQQVAALMEGGFLDRRENILAFGNPGSGKTHLLCALCQELVRNERRVLYASCSLLVQELLAAKRDLKLPQALDFLMGRREPEGPAWEVYHWLDFAHPDLQSDPSTWGTQLVQLVK